MVGLAPDGDEQMSQQTPFSQTKKYRDLAEDDIAELTEEQAREQFALYRWGSTTVMPCPSCGTVDRHYVRKSRKQWRCKHCYTDFSCHNRNAVSESQNALQEAAQTRI